MGIIDDDRALWLARHVLPHEGSLRGWLEAKHIDGLEVDDIVQETYSILASLESVAEIRNPKNYAYQVAYSVVATYLRRMNIVSFRALSTFDRLTISSGDPSPESHAADREELHRLADAISNLPKSVRQVFVMRRVEGLSQRDIAAKLGISENTVEKHVGRGIQLLMERFGRGGKARAQTSINVAEPEASPQGEGIVRSPKS